MQSDLLLSAVNWVALREAIGLTLLHSLWLGLTAAIAAAIVIAATSKSSPALRHNMLVGVTGLFVLSVCVCFGLVYTSEVVHAYTIPPVTNEVAGIAIGNHADVLQQFSFRDQLTTWIRMHADMIVGIWFMITLVQCGQLFIRVNRLYDPRRLQFDTNHSLWSEEVLVLSKHLGIQAKVKVYECLSIAIPCTIGFLKPFILVPAGMLTNLPPQQAESILLHELAHIKRNDYALNICLEAVKAVFFFNPGIRWILSLIKEEREICCDAIVTEYYGHPEHYVQALMAFEEQAIHQPRFAMRLANKHSLLFYRLKRIIYKRNKNLSAMEKILLVTSIAAVISFSFTAATRTTSATEVVAPTKEIPAMKPTPVKQAVAVVPVATAVKLKANQPAVKKAMPATAVKLAKQPAIATNKNDQPADTSLLRVYRHTRALMNKRIDFTDVLTADGKHYSFAVEAGKINFVRIDGNRVADNEISKYENILSRAQAYPTTPGRPANNNYESGGRRPRGDSSLNTPGINNL
jgi:bla regulator protein BlaR1